MWAKDYKWLDWLICTFLVTKNNENEFQNSFIGYHQQSIDISLDLWHFVESSERTSECTIRILTHFSGLMKERLEFVTQTWFNGFPGCQKSDFFLSLISKKQLLEKWMTDKWIRAAFLPHFTTASSFDNTSRTATYKSEEHRLWYLLFFLTKI